MTAMLKVKVFPGAQNLPIYAGVAHGHFARRGVDVELLFTRNSVELRQGLADGSFDVAHTAVDNAVAMHQAGHEVVVILGGDDGMNELFVQPRFADIDALRGETLIVDAPDTAYALQARKILLDSGLKANVDYKLLPIGATFEREAAMARDESLAASILNPPFSIRSAARGLKSLGRVTDFIGPYQATTAFVMRPVLQSRRDVLVDYIAGYLDALAWCFDGVHRRAAVALLQERLNLDEGLASQTCAQMLDPHCGLTRDARIDEAGLRNVLALRHELLGGFESGLPELSRYLDLSCYEEARSRTGVSNA